MAGVEIEQLLLVGGELEKIALLLDPFDRRTLRADTFARVVEPGLVLVVIRFIAHRGPAGILAEVNVARRFHLLPDGDRRTMVALFGGSDEYVVRAVESLHHGLETRHVAFDQLRWGELLLRRSLQHFDAVLIGTGDEEHVVAVEPHETRDCIGRDRLVGMADMGRAIGIGDGRGEIIAGLVGHRSVPWSVVIPCLRQPPNSRTRTPLGRPRIEPDRLPGMTEMAGQRGPPPTNSAGVPTRP